MSLRFRLVFIFVSLLLALCAVLVSALVGLRHETQAVGAWRDAQHRQQWLLNRSLSILEVRHQVRQQQLLYKTTAGQAILAAKDQAPESLNASYLNQVVQTLQHVVRTDLSQMAVVDQPLAIGPDQLSISPQEALQRLAENLKTWETRAAADVNGLQTRWQKRHNQSQNLLWTVSLLSFAALTLIGWTQYLGIRSSFRKLNARVQRIASGRINERLPEVRGDREMAELTQNINLVAERLHGLLVSLEERVRVQSTALARAERLASVGFLAAGVAHEINNPLAVIAGEAELLDPSNLTPEQAEAIAVIRDEAFKCKAITQRLLVLSKPGGREYDPIDLRPIAEGVLRNARTIAKENGARLVCQVPENLVVEADSIEMKQVLLNLVVNAIEADAKTVRVVGVLDPERIGVAVLDDGRGLEPEQLLKVFEPFYTSKTGSGGGGGTGLGLALAYAIVEQSGGLMEAFSDGPFKGCQFVISWPRKLDLAQATKAEEDV